MNYQSLGPGLTEADEILVTGSMLDCGSLDPGFKETGERLIIPMVAHWTANY